MKAFTINVELVSIFEQKMKKFIKKFDKYGVCEYTKSEPYICEDKSNPKYGYKVVDINVNASYKICDYEFVATCDWFDEINENLIKKPNADVYVPEIYKTRVECDHCKALRNRKHTVILKKGDAYIQVGKSCCKDYIGVDLGNYAAYLSFYSDLEEYLEDAVKNSSIRINPSFELDYALAQTVELTKHYGYISKKIALEQDCDSTSTRLWLLLRKVTDTNTGKLLYPAYEITADTISEVNAIKDFYANCSEENDFIGNIKSVLKMKFIEGDCVGLAAAAIGTKLRLENEKAILQSKPVSEYVGEIGQRITFKTKATCIYSTDTMYGTLYMYKMMFENNEIVWSTSKSIDCDVDIEITGTIRDHKEYKGVKQTEITRARIKEVIA